MPRTKIGDRLKRSEDIRFLTGHGCYVDDLPSKDLAHIFVLRSPHAHARIIATNTKEAVGLPGETSQVSNRKKHPRAMTQMQGLQTNIVPRLRLSWIRSVVQFPLCSMAICALIQSSAGGLMHPVSTVHVSVSMRR